MSDSLFEHIDDVPQKKIRRLSQRQIERLLTPKDASVTVSGLLWSLDLGAYALPGGDLVIGFEADERVHAHDQWLFYTASPTSPWVSVERDDRRSLRNISQFGNFVDTVKNRAADTTTEAIDFLILKGLAGAVARTKTELREGAGLEVTSRDILLASRIPGALNPVYLREHNTFAFRDAHDLLFHTETFYERFPQYKGLPVSYVQHLEGLESTGVLLGQ